MFPVFALLSLIFSVLLIIPIGGADMPTVISVLNSYAGLSAVTWGSCSITLCSSSPAPSTPPPAWSFRSSCAGR
ncbi:MAG TPA: NAD(P)(+) transhydrogenase (Re/Si-specific) subunit beta [Thermoanaerobaculia bacterium]|nr:NAD(P)(+) transhydrogenase (Re/Si-specific) subunit beta [Thermoanaerobaculia bacterium]